MEIRGMVSVDYLRREDTGTHNASLQRNDPFPRVSHPRPQSSDQNRSGFSLYAGTHCVE